MPSKSPKPSYLVTEVIRVELTLYAKGFTLLIYLNIMIFQFKYGCRCMQMKSENWIKSLYQRSWEMELLICGFAIFLLLQVSGEFDNAHQWLNYHIAADDSLIHPLIKTALVIGYLAVTTLIIFLVINLIFRAYWIALIGMLSSIKKPYGYLKYSANRKQNLAQVVKSRSIGKHINKVDEIGSQIFAIAFLFIGYFTSAFVILLEVAVLIFFMQFFEENNLPMTNIVVFVMISFSLLMMVYFIDLIFNGCISKVASSKLNRPYRHFERFMRYMSLYFVYEKLDLTVRRGYFANKIGAVIIGFTILWVSFLVHTLHSTNFADITHKRNTTEMGSMYIVDLSQHDDLAYLNMPAIEKTFFDSLPIKLLIPLNKSFTTAFEKRCLVDDAKKVTLTCVAEQITVNIGEQEVEIMFGYQYLKDVEKNVIVAYLTPKSLRNGKHTLTLDISFVGKTLKTDIWYFK